MSCVALASNSKYTRQKKEFLRQRAVGNVFPCTLLIYLPIFQYSSYYSPYVNERRKTFQRVSTRVASIFNVKEDLNIEEARTGTSIHHTCFHCTVRNSYWPKIPVQIVVCSAINPKMSEQSWKSLDNVEYKSKDEIVYTRCKHIPTPVYKHTFFDYAPICTIICQL